MIAGGSNSPSIYVPAAPSDRHGSWVHFELKNTASDSLYKIELIDDGSDGTLAQLDFRYSAINPLGLKVIRN